MLPSVGLQEGKSQGSSTIPTSPAPPLALFFSLFHHPKHCNKETCFFLQALLSASRRLCCPQGQDLMAPPKSHSSCHHSGLF